MAHRQPLYRGVLLHAHVHEQLNPCTYMCRSVVCTDIHNRCSEVLNTDKAVCLFTRHSALTHCTVWTICWGVCEPGVCRFLSACQEVVRRHFENRRKTYMYTSNHLSTTPKWHSPYTRGGPPHALPYRSHSDIVDCVLTHTTKTKCMFLPELPSHTESIHLWYTTCTNLQYTYTYAPLKRSTYMFLSASMYMYVGVCRCMVDLCILYICSYLNFLLHTESIHLWWTVRMYMYVHVCVLWILPIVVAYGPHVCGCNREAAAQ